MKKYIGGIAAILLAVSASAFTYPHAAKSGTSQWYLYNPMFSGGESNYQNYTAFSGKPSCTTGSSLCAVFTSADPQGHPIVPVTDPNDRKKFN
jgi:hypothetical protein